MQILNQIIISSIEIFLSILNAEILNKKNLSYNFQIYIIQQILLCLEIVETFQIETVETGIELDFNFITDMFKTNYETIVSGKFTVAEVLSNSAPKILDKTRDYKKILYNNLLKSYKMFVNLSNEFIFGRELIDIHTKIKSKEKTDELIELIITKQKDIIAILEEMTSKENAILKDFEEQIKMVDESVNEKINKVVKDNMNRILRGVISFIDEHKGEKLNELKEAIGKLNRE